MTAVRVGDLGDPALAVAGEGDGQAGVGIDAGGIERQRVAMAIGFAGDLAGRRVEGGGDARFIGQRVVAAELGLGGIVIVVIIAAEYSFVPGIRDKSTGSTVSVSVTPESGTKYGG